MAFPFESTPVYQLSLQFNNQLETLFTSLRSQVTPGLIDQLRRAGLSIPLNIAEDYGRWHKADKQNFYRIARGSVFECVPILQILKLRSILDDQTYRHHYDKLQELARMLTGLIKALEANKTPQSINPTPNRNS